jgi:hypothetical protein
MGGDELGQLLLQSDYFILSCEKSQDVTRGLVVVDLQNGVQCGGLVVLCGLEKVVDFGRIGPTFHLDHGFRIPEAQELAGFNGCGHDNNAKLLPSLKFTLQYCHQHISIYTPLMCLIQNEHIIMNTNHQLPNRHPIRDKSYFRALPLLLLKTHIIPHLLTDLIPHLSAHSLRQCYRTDPPRLGDHDVAIMREQKLGYLGGFTTPCLPTDHAHCITPYHLHNFLSVLGDGEAKFLVHDC